MCSGFEVDSYVYEYYSVAKMSAAYADNVPALLGKHQWEFVDPGVHIFGPRLVREAIRPIKNRIRSPAEGKGKKRQRKCGRCGQFGHKKANCNNEVTMEFLDGITERDNVEEDEDDIEDAGPTPTVPSAWYGCLWFFYCSRSIFSLLFLYSMHFYLECQL